MTIPTLDQLLDAAEEHAQRVCIELQQQLIPLFDLRDADGNSYLVAGEFTGDNQDEVDRCKDAFAAFVRGKIAEHGIVAYSFMSEAWMIVRPEYTPGVSVRPAQADDRVEVVIAIATDGADYEMRRWLIKRRGEICVDLLLDKSEGETPRPWGRFDSLLRPEAMQ